ncbi:MAG: hypothetical protein IJ489_06815 [Clostridia bacterium]|nr:hypothetical protein [Clostridia bacterium]
MKKIITAMLIAGMILSFASCNNNNNEDTSDTSASTSETTETTETTDTTDTTDTTTENNGGEVVASADAKATLEGLFDTFHDKLAPAFGVESGAEIKGAYVGMDMETVTEVDPETNEEFSYDMPKAAPSAIDLSSEESPLYMTYFPAELTDKLDSAALFFSMMNANTNGTFAAFEVKDAADVQTIADALKEALANNMWMCGSPDAFYIAEVNGVVISAFAGNDPLNAFKDAVAATYENVNVLYNEAIAF